MGAASRSTSLRLCAAPAISTLAHAASRSTMRTTVTGSASHALYTALSQVWCFHPNFPGMMQVPVLQYHVQCGLQRQFLPCDQQLAQTEEEPAIAAVQRLDAFTPKQVTPAGLRTLWCRQRMHPLSGSCPATPAWLRAEHLAGMRMGHPAPTMLC